MWYPADISISGSTSTLSAGSNQEDHDRWMFSCLTGLECLDGEEQYWGSARRGVFFLPFRHQKSIWIRPAQTALERLELQPTLTMHLPQTTISRFGITMGPPVQRWECLEPGISPPSWKNSRMDFRDHHLFRRSILNGIRTPDCCPSYHHRQSASRCPDSRSPSSMPPVEYSPPCLSSTKPSSINR